MDIVKGKTTGIVSINGLIHEIEDLKVTKQDLLVNQVNIKSINNESLLIEEGETRTNIDIDTASLKTELTTTIEVGGVPVGTQFEKGTQLEDIIRQMLYAKKTLESIRVATPPVKVNYTVDDTFDPTGMVVKAKYNMAGVESEEVVTNYTYQPTTPLTEADTKIIISFNGKTTEQPITVGGNTIKIYMGLCNELPTTQEQIEALTLDDTKTKPELLANGYTRKNISPDNQYVVLAIPVDSGLIVDEIIVGGFSLGFNQTEIGDYYMYSHDNPASGKYTFKYTFMED